MMQKERRKGKKNHYLSYDYEAVYTEGIDQLAEKQMLDMLKQGRGSIYATKEIRSGDQLEVEVYPQFTRAQSDRIPDEGRRKKQRQAQKNLNDKNSKKMCERVINSNFTDRDLWITLTYTDENAPKSMEEANKNMARYIARINYRRKKLGLSNVKYVYVTECSNKGRWHHHMVMDGDMDMDTAEQLWKLGKRNEVRRLQRDENGLTGLARYITKTPKEKTGTDDGKGQKTWRTSKGLKRPEEKVTHYKIKSKDVGMVVKDHETLPELLKKWFGAQGYKYNDCEIKYNEFNCRFYIYARMHREGEWDNERTKKPCQKKARAGTTGARSGRKKKETGQKRKKVPGKGRCS